MAAKKKEKKKAAKRLVDTVAPKNALESVDFDAGGPAPRTMRSDGPARGSLQEPENIALADKMPTGDKVETERFMQDVLTVMVHESANENDDPMPVVIVNGVRQFFIRGMEQEVKRKFVAVLAQAKITRIQQRLVTDAEGRMSYEHLPRTAHIFPFSVIHDPAGQKGRDWLKNVIAQS